MARIQKNPTLDPREDDPASPLMPMEAGLADLRRRMAEADARPARPPVRTGRTLIAGAIAAVALSVGLMIYWLMAR